MNEAPNHTRQQLEALIFDSDLERLETLLAEFNIFEAIGAVRQELRHSDFLAFLLNPNQSHGLGDIFLKLLLRHLLIDLPEPPLNAIELDLIDMDQAIVLREWQSIDILIDDAERNNLICLIENKIGSTEHSGQLQRYLKTVRQKYPEATVIPVYLTPEGNEASEDDYLTLGYETVAKALGELLQAQSSTMGPDIRTIVTHYLIMLRRHIVSESEIAQLCRRIYRRHQSALDLIFEYRPDLQGDIAESLLTLINGAFDLTPDHCSKSSLRFIPRVWDDRASLRLGQGWTRSRRLLLFELRNSEDRLDLYLIIGPGPNEIRERLFDLATANSNHFPHCSRSLYPKYTTIYRRDILRSKQYEEASLDDLIGHIQKEWLLFYERDLPAIRDLVMDADLPPA